MALARTHRTTASEIIGIVVPICVAVGFVLGLIAGRSFTAGANGAGLASVFALPICGLTIWGTISNGDNGSGPGWWKSAVVVLALAGAVTTLLVIHPDRRAASAAPRQTPTTSAPTPTGQPSVPSLSMSPSAVLTSTTAPPSPTPRSAAPVGWPTSANDGSSAMYAYFGSEFYFPDWVSCEQTYCLTGDGPQIHVYTQHPIKRVNTFNADVPDPYQKLIALRFTPVQARALLKED